MRLVYYIRRPGCMYSETGVSDGQDSCSETDVSDV